MISLATTFAVTLILALSSGLAPTAGAVPTFKTHTFKTANNVVRSHPVNLDEKLATSERTPANQGIGSFIICEKYQGQGPVARLFMPEKVGDVKIEYVPDNNFQLGPFRDDIDEDEVLDQGDCIFTEISGTADGRRTEANHARLFGNKFPGLVALTEATYTCGSSGQVRILRATDSEADGLSFETSFVCDPSSSAHYVQFVITL